MAKRPAILSSTAAALAGILIFCGLFTACRARDVQTRGPYPDPGVWGDIVVPQELWGPLREIREGFLEDDVIWSVGPGPTHWSHAAQRGLEYRRAYCYYAAHVFYGRRNRSGHEVFGLMARNLEGERHEQVETATAIAEQSGLTYEGLDSQPLPSGRYKETYFFGLEQEYTLGQLATLSDQILQQHASEFDIVMIWGETGSSHDQGFGQSL